MMADKVGAVSVQSCTLQASEIGAGLKMPAGAPQKRVAERRGSQRLGWHGASAVTL